MARPVAAATLTTLAVFVPMIFTQGLASVIFRDLSYTISFALFVSLTVALTLLPVLSSKFLSLPRNATILRPSDEHDEGAGDPPRGAKVSNS